MQEGRITPLAGRAALGAKEAVTGSVFLAIIINIIILVFVQLAIMSMLRVVPALFWTFIAILIAADIALCPLIFRLALKEVRENASAPPYTVALCDGGIVIYHKDGKSEVIPTADLEDITARPARFGYMLIGWAYAGRLSFGTLTFIVRGKEGEGPCKRRVKYVVNCVRTAEFIKQVVFSRGVDE